MTMDFPDLSKNADRGELTDVLELLTRAKLRIRKKYDALNAQIKEDPLDFDQNLCEYPLDEGLTGRKKRQASDKEIERNLLYVALGHLDSVVKCVDRVSDKTYRKSKGKVKETLYMKKLKDKIPADNFIKRIK